MDEMLAWPHEWIQLHGREDEQVAEELRSEGYQIIRGFRFDPVTVERWDRCPAVDRLVIDGSTVGGTGEAFDHEALKAMSSMLETPLLVAGGLTPTNVASLIETMAPWGVDVSSGVESSRGRKNPELIEAFCAAVRAASA
jgi:phosphoribosylanthranilate isomerase